MGKQQQRTTRRVVFLILIASTVFTLYRSFLTMLTMAHDERWPSIEDFLIQDVNCGAHYSSSCADCPQGHGELYCNGDCWWNSTLEECIRRTSQVSCGEHFSPSCAECPKGNGAGYCNGDCIWDDTSEDCVPNPGIISASKYTMYGVVTEDEVTYLHKLLSIVVQKFREHDISYWLDGGTLLGAMRNHPPGLLRQDDDIDLGIRDADYDRMHDILSRDNRLSWVRGDWGGWKYGLSNYSSSSTYWQYSLDIFRYFYVPYQGNDTNWYSYNSQTKEAWFPSCYYEESEINDTVSCTFWDLTVQCPKGTMNYIMRCYGSDALTKAFLYSHSARSQIQYEIDMEEHDLNDHAAFLPGLNKALKDKLLPNPNLK